MLFSDITILAPDFTLREHQYVAVKDHTICYVGEEKPPEDYGTVYHGTDKLLLAGLVNTDSHSPMYGGLGALGCGINASDAAVALATGKIWMYKFSLYNPWVFTSYLLF